MDSITHYLYTLFLVALLPLCTTAGAQMIGNYGANPRVQVRQNQHKQLDVSPFNFVNGRIYTPGLAILLAPQPFTAVGGDFLHLALEVSGDGKLAVPPHNTSDSLTQIFNFTIFLTSSVRRKNFTISNMTTSTPPLANIMEQEPGSTVKHVNFEWPDCLVGDGPKTEGTQRGDYNISIHQNFRLNGNNYYTIFNLPVLVANNIPPSPDAGQDQTRPPPGPLSATGGRVSCASLENPMLDPSILTQSVKSPNGQPMQDIPLQTSSKNNDSQPGNSSQNAGGSNGQSQGKSQATMQVVSMSIWGVIASTIAVVMFDVLM